MFCESCDPRITDGDNPRCSLCGALIDPVQRAEQGDIKLPEPLFPTVLPVLHWLRVAYADSVPNIIGQTFLHWTAPDDATEAIVVSQSLFKGKLGFLVDIGAHGNLIGAQMAKAQSHGALERGLASAQHKRSQLTKVVSD